MIIEGEELKRNNNYVEIKQLKEVRPGRQLMIRKVVINQSSNSSKDNCSNVSILFIHGSCAASRQFDSLLEVLSQDNRKKHMHCYLYDQLGCGESKHPSNDWNAYSSIEHGEDMLIITKSILESMHHNAQLYVAAHSYGVSQTIKLLNTLDADVVKRVGGAIFIGGGLSDGPSELTKDGGHWIFKYIPIFFLKKIQPGLSKNFVDAAIHPKNHALKDFALECSNGNDMEMCRAFYRQQIYATSEEAKAVKIKTIVIHGQDDLVLPVEVGEHLHKSLSNSELHIIPDTRHQVFEEEPRKVAELLLNLFL